MDESLVALIGDRDRGTQRLLMAFRQIKGVRNRMKVVEIVEAVAAAFVETAESEPRSGDAQ